MSWQINCWFFLPEATVHSTFIISLTTTNVCFSNLRTECWKSDLWKSKIYSGLELSSLCSSYLLHPFYCIPSACVSGQGLVRHCCHCISSYKSWFLCCGLQLSLVGVLQAAAKRRVLLSMESDAELSQLSHSETQRHTHINTQVLIQYVFPTLRFWWFHVMCHRTTQTSSWFSLVWFVPAVFEDY